MASTADFRNGLTFEYDRDIMQLVEFQHVKPGKGGAFVRTKIKSLTTGKVLTPTFRSGEKIEIIYEDSKLDPKEAVSIINSLYETKNVTHVYAWGTPVISGIQPITESNHIVMFAGSISPSVVQGKNYTVRLFYNLQQALGKFSEFIKNNNVSRLSVLYQNGDSWERQVGGLEKSGVAFNVKERFDIGERDFKTALIKIKESKPDVIILLGYGSHFPQIFKQAKELGINTAVLGGLDFLEVPKDELYLYDTSIFVVPSFNVYPNGNSLDFIKKYESKFNKTPDHQASYAYDTINFFYLSLEKTDGSADEVIKFIKNFGYYNGVSGRIEILPNGDTKSDLVFATYKNGKIVAYDPW